MNPHVLKVTPQVFKDPYNVLQVRDHHLFYKKKLQLLKLNISKVQALEPQVLDVETSKVQVSEVHILEIQVSKVQVSDM